jgi:hypothetical protein
MKILVIASASVTGTDLRSAVGDEAADDAEVLVVAPALHSSPLRFWLSDADAAIGDAARVQRSSVDSLEDAGISASGDTGEAEPLEAVADSLQTFAADRIVIFGHTADDPGYHGELDADEVERRFGLPTSQHPISA